MKIFTRTALATVAAIALSGAATAAYDSQTCKAFISGTWTTMPGEKTPGLRTTYDVGGTYQQGNESPAVGDGKDAGESGSWDAQPTEDGSGCKLMLTPTGGAPRLVTLAIVDDNTIKADDGAMAHRVKGEMEASPP